ncbi:MAG TPA: 50S ribosomal protein L25 [Balneolaceae bacterium]|nr:50S ribosomal protein L25 [Balneolaceae bacterium]
MKKPEIYELEGIKRETGKKTSSQLRDELRIPSVLYGPKVKENIHFSISEADIDKILSVSQTKLQNLKIDGKSYDTLLKNVEFDPVSDRALHADFYVLDESTMVSLKVPIRITGSAKGVVEGGGRVYQALRIIRIKVLPEKIPAMFEVDISDLDIGDSVHVSELKMEGIVPLDDPSRTIVTITPPKSEALFETAIEPEEEELEEGELELAEGEEVPEGEEAAAEETEEESKE